MRSSWLVAAAVLVSSTGAWAADVQASSTTLFGARPDLVNGQVRTVVPLYELVGLRARGIDTPVLDDVGITVDAWGALAVPGEPPAGLSGDVNLVYVEGKAFKKHLNVRLGRQFVTGGVARNQYFDGLLLDLKGTLGFGLTGFVGQPVRERFANFLRGDLASGARLYWAPSTDAQIGASFIYTAQKGALSREDIGADARWVPWRSLTLLGSITWSVDDKRLVELDVGPRWQPLEDLEVALAYRRTAPDLFLARNSIFSVFAETSRDDAGASIAYQLTRSLGIYGDGRALWINKELGYELGLRATYKLPRLPTSNASLQFRRLSIPSNAFTQARLGARHVMPMGLGLAVDLETYVLDQAIRGKNLSFSSAITATWQLADAWMVGLTFFGATTPTFDGRYEVMAKLAYNFPGESRTP